MKLFPAFVAFAALAACATPTEWVAGPNFYVMRHLNKAEGPDPGLSAEGSAAAKRLVTLLAKDPPRVIYVSSTRRARETAALVAAKWKLVPKEYDPGDTAALVAHAKAEVGTVLIVGHSNTVPDIVEALGGERPAPLADTDYGDVWHLFLNPPRTKRLRV